MQPGGKFSLAGALFDWLVAEGYASPDEHAPDTWRAAFEGCADAEVWLGLFSSCRGGRDWAWRTAPSAGLVLDCTVSGRTQAARQQHFSAVKQCLGARGALTTKLTAVCDKDLTRDSSALSAVSGVGAGIVSLQMRSVGVHSVPREGPATALLDALALACPNTTSITLIDVKCELPHPRKLTRLTDVIVKSSGGRDPHSQSARVMIPRGIKAYSAQLTSLQLDAANDGWTQLLSPLTTLPKLTHFHTHRLPGQILTHLVHQAPALKHVTVGGLSIDREWARVQWGVDTLVVTDSIDGKTLAKLPNRRDGGRLVVTAPTLMLKVTQQGLARRAAARYHDVSVSVEHIDICMEAALDDQAAALRNTMHQLSSLVGETSKGNCMLKEWGLTVGVVSVLADTMPTLPDRGFGWRVTNHHLTDQQLSMLLGLEPQLRRLSVGGLSLQSDQHANAPWPWEELTVWECDAAMLLKLPSPAGAGAPRVLRCAGITFNATAVTENTAAELCNRLQHIQCCLDGVQFISLNTGIRVTCECSPDHQDIQHVRRLLTALRAVRLSDIAQGRPVTVTLKGWRFTPRVSTQLADLPRWKGPLLFEACEWHGMTERVANQLVQAIPGSYRVVSNDLLPETVQQALHQQQMVA